MQILRFARHDGLTGGASASILLLLIGLKSRYQAKLVLFRHLFLKEGTKARRHVGQANLPPLLSKEGKAPTAVAQFDNGFAWKSTVFSRVWFALRTTIGGGLLAIWFVMAQWMAPSAHHNNHNMPGARNLRRDTKKLIGD